MNSETASGPSRKESGDQLVMSALGARIAVMMCICLPWAGLRRSLHSSERSWFTSERSLGEGGLLQGPSESNEGSDLSQDYINLCCPFSPSQPTEERIAR